MFSTAGRLWRGFGFRVVLAALGVAALIATASVGAARASSVTPTYHAGNVNSCADVAPGTHGIDIQSPSGSGTFDDGTLAGSYTVSGDLTTFAWTSDTVPVNVVVVKGGPDANVYDYGTGALGDAGLVSPYNPGANVPAISHVLLCYGRPVPPPPPAKGKIVVQKQTVPAGADQLFTFHPSASLADADFQLGDGGEQVFQPAPGSYTVQELPTDGWTLTKLSCDGGVVSQVDSSTADGTAHIDLASGETIVCTFTNTKDAPPVDNPPPPDNPPPGKPPVTPPTVTPPTVAPPIAVVTPPAQAAAPAQAVAGTRAARGTARLRTADCSARRARVTVSGSPMRRVVFSVGGHRIKTVAVRAGRRSVTVSLPFGRVTARVTFRNGAAPRTLHATARSCAQRVVRPSFTG